MKIPYGVSDFKTIRNEGLYYVDKTEYLARLEERDSEEIAMVSSVRTVLLV